MDADCADRIAAELPLKNYRVLILVDVSFVPPSDFRVEDHLSDDDWEDERDVYQALKKLGHDVEFCTVFADLQALLNKIDAFKPDLVFVLCESFKNNRDHAANLVGLLQLLGIPHTGVSPHPMQICMDKGLTKKILSFHRIKVPRFEISERRRPIKSLKQFTFPAIVKPLQMAGSEGITQTSLVENEKDTLERCKFIHEKFDCDAIVEEYIEGRELYLSVMGTKRLSVFPPQELFFDKMAPETPKFATYKVKWDAKYRKKWGIHSGASGPLDPIVKKRMDELARKIYRIFGLNGYARIDARLTESGQIYFLEANPNPSIAKDGDFAKAAAAHGIEYEELITRIISQCVP